MSGQDETLTAQAGCTLLRRLSSGRLSIDSLFTNQRLIDKSSQSTPAQEQTTVAVDQLRSAGQAASCMDAGLQWDAAILTVMIEGNAEAAVQGAAHLSSLVASAVISMLRASVFFFFTAGVSVPAVLQIARVKDGMHRGCFNGYQDCIWMSSDLWLSNCSCLHACRLYCASKHGVGLEGCPCSWQPVSEGG